MEFKSKSRILPQKSKQQFRIISGSNKSKPKTPPLFCIIHPKHKQSPGVCAMCLREKLNQLPATSSNTQKTTKKNKHAGSSCSSSSLTSLSSHESSNASSSVMLLRSGKKLFTNSKLMGGIGKAIPKTKMATMDDQMEKKEGFWSKILRPRKKKDTLV